MISELLLKPSYFILQDFDFSISVGDRRRRRNISHFLLERLLYCVLFGDIGYAFNHALKPNFRPLYLFLLAVKVALYHFLGRQWRFHLISPSNLLPLSHIIFMCRVVELSHLFLRKVSLQYGRDLSLDPRLLVSLFNGGVENVDDVLELIAIEDDLIEICKLVIVEHVFVLFVGKG